MVDDLVKRARDDVAGHRDPNQPATWATAFHESAHSVVAVAFGVRFRAVTIRPGQLSDGTHYRGALLGVTPDATALTRAAVQIAGPYAHTLAAGDRSYQEVLCTSGRRDAERVAELDLNPDALASICRRVHCMVTDTYADAIATVAHQLVHTSSQTLPEEVVVSTVLDHRPGGHAYELAALIARVQHRLAARASAH